MFYKRLFNEYEAHTGAGNCFEREIEEAIRPIVDEYMVNGFDSRDMCNVLIMTVTQIMAERALVRATERRKKNQGEKAYLAGRKYL